MLRVVRLARAGLSRLRTRLPGAGLRAVNVALVDRMSSKLPHDEAMEAAIGGRFAEIGAIQLALLKHYGLKPESHVVDVGCGSGRLAKPLSEYLTGNYLGVDLVPALVAHARRIVRRPDWRFETVDHIAIPEADGRADMVCFFSVLTHLTHEQGYWYLEEAKRVLRPGGRIVLSFLEFAEPAHVHFFHEAVRAAKQKSVAPANVFLERGALEAFARELGLSVADFRSGGEAVAPEGSLGQSLCVLEKPV